MPNIRVAFVAAGLLIALWIAVGAALDRIAAVVPSLGMTIVVCALMAFGAQTQVRAGRRGWAWFGVGSCIFMPAAMLAVLLADRTAAGRAFMITVLAPLVQAISR